MPDVVDPNTPAAGFYMTRLTRGGVLVPVAIRWEGERDEDTGEPIEDLRLVIEVNGQQRRDPWDGKVWPWCAKHPIEESEYRYLVADAAHAEQHRPHDPKATPGEPVNWNTAELPF